MTGPDQPLLLAPVSPRSVLVRVPDVGYTEVDGGAVLCRPAARAVHAISPAAAAIWGRLDGRRTLAEVAADLDPGAGADQLGSVVELIRRLRALGLVEDARPGDRPDGDGPLPGAPWDHVAAPEVVEVRGTLGRGTNQDDRGGSGSDGPAWVLRLDPDDAETTTAAVVAIRVADDPPTTEQGRLDRVEVPTPDAADGPATGERLTAHEALEVLVRSVDERALARPGTLDALAGLAERVAVHPATGEVDAPSP